MSTYYRVQQYAMPVFMIVLIVLPYVLHVNPVGVYLDVTAGNVANLLFPFGVFPRGAKLCPTKSAPQASRARSIFCCT